MPLENDFFVIAAMTLLLVAWLGWIVRAMFRPPLTALQNSMLIGCRLIVRMLWRGDHPRRLPIPEDRGAVLVCNHRSSIDPFFLQATTNRPLHWMVAREFTDHPAFRGFLRACETIPVNRGGVDTAATKLAIRYASNRGVVGMFPEGRINMSERFMLPVRPGAAMIAIKAGALVVPCLLEGSPYRRTAWSPFFMPARVHLRFGEPIEAREYAARAEQGEDETELAQELLVRTVRAIASLAGEPDFVPQLAGRNWKPSAEEVAAAADEQERRLKREASR